ncbi:Glutamine synthetase 1, mitochondrial, partial [Geodia barretti]
RFRVDDSPSVATYLFRGDEFLRRRLFIERENSVIKAKNLGLWRPAGRGYLEDRRPSSNGDPYLVCEALVRTAVLDDWTDFDWTNMPSKP